MGQLEAEAAEAVHWYKKWDKVLDRSRPPFDRWFTGGVVNTCYNALDIHVEQGRGEQPALIYDSPVTGTIETFTYGELLIEVARFAGVLKGQGIEKGDRDGKTLLDAMKAGSAEGMQHFDGEIAQLVRDRIVDLETGLSYASNPTVLGQELAR